VSGNKEGETLKCAVRASFVGCYLTDVFLVSYCILTTSTKEQIVFTFIM
jgi:hypothetical protein